MDAIGADFIRTVDETLAEIDLTEHALPRHDAWRNGHVVVRRDRPVEWNLRAVAGERIVARPRHQEAGFALHGRVGRREIRQIGERLTEELHLRIFEVEHLLGLVVDDARGLHLPERRTFGMIAAGGAGGIGAALEDGDIAIAAVSARRRHARFVRRIETQRIDEAVAIVVGKVEQVGVHHLAVGLGETDVAFGVKAFGLLIVDDLVGLECRAVVVDLHVADGGDAVVVVVVIDLERLHEHLPVIGVLVLRRFRHRGTLVVDEIVGGGRGGTGQGKRARAEHQNGGHSEAIAAQPHAPPELRRPSMEGGKTSHYPSS